MNILNRIIKKIKILKNYSKKSGIFWAILYRPVPPPSKKSRFFKKPKKNLKISYKKKYVKNILLSFILIKMWQGKK